MPFGYLDRPGGMQARHLQSLVQNSLKGSGQRKVGEGLHLSRAPTRQFSLL